MDLLESFINWIKKVAEPVIDLYNKDSNMFFIGAIVLILILLIIVIVLARRAEDSNDRPKKRIRYEDIDWSVDGEGNGEAAETADAVKGRRAARRAEEETKRTEEAEATVKEETHAEAVLTKEPSGQKADEEVRLGAFDVPLWMTKHTISIDQANSMEAQEWIDQQLAARRTVSQKLIHETERHAEEIGKLALEIPDEKLVCIVTHDKEEVEEPVSRRAPHIIDENTFVVSDREFDKYAEQEKPEQVIKEPAAEPEIKEGPAVKEEPETTEAPSDTASDMQLGEARPVNGKISADYINEAFESGTLAKIIREAEELKSSEEGAELSGKDIDTGTDTTAEIEATEPQVDGILGLDTDNDPDGVPSWDIRETLKKLETMQSENESMARDIGISEYTEPAEEPAIDRVEDKEPETDKTDIQEGPSVPDILLRPNNYLPGDEEMESSLKQEYEQMLKGEDEMQAAASSSGDLNDSIELHTGRIRRFGPNNRDTNRSGRKFTEEELIRQIRD